MFNTPIRHTRLEGMEDLLKFSYRTDNHSERTLVVTQNNGQIAFSDKYGCIYVTPYRTEIHKILNDAGYREEYSLFVPFSNGEERPEAYKWLQKIADEENKAVTCEDAYKEAQKKGIKPVNVSQHFHIKEITFFDDTDTHTLYSALTTTFLFNESKENIATYIVVDEKTLVICDEYGRTFLLKAKTVINDTVNALIEAGYKRTVHPERYVHHYTPEKQTLSPPLS